MRITKGTYSLEKLGLKIKKNIKRNLPLEKLIEDILLNNEGKIGMNGAVMVDTGSFTGRSPKDKYFVEEPQSSKNLWWGDVNKKISEKIFNDLYSDVIDYYNKNEDSDTYIFDGFGGAATDHQLSVRIIAKRAWQAHFCNNMFIRPQRKDLESFNPDFTIINASGFKNTNYKNQGLNSETFIIFNLSKKIAIIGGTEYGGEMKKGIFSVLNYILPLNGILSMHCSANVDNNNKNTALYFGLSGTGKTTLSTDPNRPLIGDDEHGWSDEGIFNFEGGCYAKVANLDKDAEPDIFNAIKHGALLENVSFDEETRNIDFTDVSKTENTRVSYPINYIKNSIFASGKPSVGPNPKIIIFLTCDAYGVLPPLSRLNSDQAMYHFISGYTAKVAGTERGINEPEATFSPCFGGPFLTLHPLKYAELLKEKIKKHNANVYLVNTGWSGGSASSGAKRISINNTRKMITSILDGSIKKSNFKKESIFNLSIPLSINGIDPNILDPRKSWTDKEEYDVYSKKLANLFVENFKIYGTEVEYLVKSGPKMHSIEMVV